MTYPLVKIAKISQGIALLILNRPEKRNALSIELMEQICSALEDLQETQDCRVVILYAEGKVFCAGLDLNEATDPKLIERSAAHVSKLLTTIYSYPLITITALEGDVFAGGAGFVAASDMVVASNAVKIGFPEVRRGLVPAQILAVLIRQLRRKDLNELLLTGEAMTAQRAYEMGFINRIVNSGQALQEAITLAKMVLRGGPDAIKQTKRLIRTLDPSFSDDLMKAFAFHENARHSQEAMEGTHAFLEKRDPNWTTT